MLTQKITTHRERGSVLVEFVLCFSLFWVPLFFGATVLGFSLIQAMQVTQVCRDAGHMYANGTDFSQSASQTLLSNLAGGMNLNSTGSSFVVLSTVTYVDASDCQAANLSPNSSSCPNINQYVFKKQIAIGNNTLGYTGSTYASVFGTPSASIKDSSGAISQQNYLTAPSALVSNFPATTGITLVSKQFTCVSEMFAAPLQSLIWSQISNPIVNARSYF